MRDALYAKAKVAACRRRAQLDTQMSSDAILSRMLQKAEGVVKEVWATLPWTTTSAVSWFIQVFTWVRSLQVIEMEEKHKKLEEEMQRLELEKKQPVGVIKDSVRVNRHHLHDNWE
jgi:hypothetical protein